MGIQETITGEKKFVGHTTTIKYGNGVEKNEFNSNIIGVGKVDGAKVIKLENDLGIADAYYKDVDPVEANEEYFMYEISEDTFQKLSGLKEI